MLPLKREAQHGEIDTLPHGFPASSQIIAQTVSSLMIGTPMSKASWISYSYNEDALVPLIKNSVCLETLYTT